MKLTEEEIIEIQELTKRITEEAQLEDLRAVQKSINQLQELVDDAFNTRFNNWYNRMLDHELFIRKEFIEKNQKKE